MQTEINRLKVFVVGGSIGYANWLADNLHITDTIAEADLVLFTGGEDVFPALYNEPAGKYTHHWPVHPELEMPSRDFIEKHCYAEALALNKPMFGVCRGIQFLTVMNGGTLVQDVDNHAGHDHQITWFDGTLTGTSSLHHQMCNPYNLPKDEYEVLAVSTEKRSPQYLNGWNQPIQIEAEPEVIYYPKTKCLGVQGHPEMMREGDIHRKLRALINEHLLVAKNEEQSVSEIN